MRTIHSYAHGCGAGVLANSLKEIFAGKIMSLFWRTRQRDLHNAWHLPKLLNIFGIIAEKFIFRGINSDFDLLFPRKNFRDAWETRLEIRWRFARF